MRTSICFALLALFAAETSAAPPPKIDEKDVDRVALFISKRMFPNEEDRQAVARRYVACVYAGNANRVMELRRLLIGDRKSLRAHMSIEQRDALREKIKSTELVIKRCDRSKDPLTMLPDYLPYGPSLGDVGAIRLSRVRQVIDEDNLLIRLDGGILLWLQGFDTAGVTDNSVFATATTVGIVTGTKTYGNVAGSSNTVLVVEPLFDFTRLHAAAMFEKEHGKLPPIEQNEPQEERRPPDA